MIPAGEDVDSVAEQLLSELRCDPESACGIFAVGDGEVDFFRRDNLFQVPRDKIPPGRSKNVTNKKEGCQAECFLKRTGRSPLCAINDLERTTKLS
jgi:hypothetical protein